MAIKKVNSKSKKVVMASGVFDLLHPGHIFYLEEAKKLGDKLIVVVASDEIAQKNKKKMIFSQNERAEIVGALRCVDRVIIPKSGERENFFKTVLEVRPEVIALGYDQKFKENDLAKELAGYGWKGEIVKIKEYPGGKISSSQLKGRGGI